ncbi:MAG: ATP-binding protein [Syntrophobacteraceae bacterium]
MDKMESKSHFFIAIACLVSIPLIGYTDYITSHEFSLFILYFIPIGVSTWFFDKSFSIVITLLGSLAWHLSAIFSHNYSIVTYIYWHTIARLIVFVVIWYLVSLAKLYINNEKLLNIELTRHIEKVDLANRKLLDFTFIASHDLQEPLRKIQTFCDMARTRCTSPIDSAGQEYLDKIFKSASRMRHLLSDLLQFSKVSSNSELFKIMNLEGIIREAANLFEEEFKESGALIEIENIPEIEASETAMLHLFQNLIENALKYRSEESPRIKIRAKRRGQEECDIFVQDNGVGFDRQFAEIIFKPFQMLHKKSDFRGTGIGLAICCTIVERHGGSIRAESEPGKGSTFIVSLPLRQNRRNGV